MSAETNQDNVTFKSAITDAFEAEGQSEDSELESAVEEGVEDTEGDTDPEISDESTEEEEQEDSEDDGDEPTDSLDDWYRTRDPQYLPDALKSVHKDLVSGGQKIYAEYRDAQKKAEAMREQYETELRNLAGGDKGTGDEPQIDYSDEDALRKSVDALVEHKVKSAIGEHITPIKEQLDIRQKDDAKGRIVQMYNDLRQREGFSDDIEKIMERRVAANPAVWQRAIVTQEGLDELFGIAMVEHKENERISASRVAKKARKAASKRPTESRGGAESVKTYSGTFSDIIAKSFEEKGLE